MRGGGGLSNGLRFSFGTAGSRFWVHPQPGFPAEAVHLPATYGIIRAGPRDDIIHVKDAKNKSSYKRYDEDGNVLVHGGPPYQRAIFDPVPPEDFDRVAPGTRPFSSTATYAAIRCTLAVWQHHVETPLLPWYFHSDALPLLEVIPQAKTDGSWMGKGFLEFGFPEYPENRKKPWAENFETVAHETGHLIMKHFTGDPPGDEKSTQYQAHEEAAADLVSLVTVLHFDAVIQDTLRRTGGYLFAITPASRVSEWGSARALEARRLFNEDTMDSVRAQPAVDKHDLSRVFSGAIYDTLVYLFQRRLHDRGLITRELLTRARHVPGEPVPRLKDTFSARLDRAPGEFEEALLDSRDYLARCLARTWAVLPLEGLTFAKVLSALLGTEAALAKELGREASGELVRMAFALRGIQPAA